METKFEAKITKIGMRAEEFQDQNMILLFGDIAPEDLEDYCFILDSHYLKKNVCIGDILFIDNCKYEITGIGDVANQNLNSLGHITLNFGNTSEKKDWLGGSIYLEEDLKNKLHLGSKIVFSSK
ncbi:hypothetical protein E0K99_09790 [Faecalicoccus pleomorphus]|uniref:PTS glucitol/sorbitol transporter subunit IIA n=1 Tax=Faecalicoccus TaxID=1573536 RepID=UPI00142F4D0A|nr:MULTISPECIES: PTS glucitol/sorbitol transporter subunit IIA [Faecalicoccus]MCI6380778.1 PTS glucitol/sorbitol transporter subunit IIA [Erysipelotrichaceae bacterium]MDB7987043.1 PTS glucitol/sorbitol transporter subunit IIA [Faecalicoccus pleomorphus]MDB7991735.1 PTS glucitol/sorbitol transporter subunit IIA [Faecalicoccus pleomorphus]MDY4278770.1 PTS glucitol/sorbitol transporter subunit IIA [Faecalicoccus sp.]MDY4870150.1 PTS glucitol/sorbitol transporter subunit IIA [Faecalicoccus sp.]